MDNLQGMNEQLEALGMAPLDIVDPRECLAQDENARYMDEQTLTNLTENVKKDGRLESVPLVEVCGNGDYRIISGHHRIEAAVKAGLEKILVMISEPSSKSERIAKQLSHNAITGKDDEVMLKKMYDQIENIQEKLYAGLQDQIDAIKFIGLNFKAGEFKEFIVGFVPEDIEKYDEIEERVGKMIAGRASTVRLASEEYFDQFAEAIRNIKKVENIKSNGSALLKILELAEERLEQLSEGEDV